MNLFKVEYEERLKGSSAWMADSKNVVAKDADDAIAKARKAVLKTVYTDTNQKTRQKQSVRVVGFRLLGVADLADVDLT